jgi:oligopeptide transport system substrate-binding protein
VKIQNLMRCVGAFVSTICLASCGQPIDDSSTLHRGNRIEPLTLDPHIAVIMDERNIVSDLFVGLYEAGPEGTPQPALARSVEVSEDGLIWTFAMRETVWSDGAPVTAHDVVAGLQRNLDPNTRNQYPSPLFMLKNAEAVNQGRMPVEALGATALGDYTVQLELGYPAPYLPSVLMFWAQPAPRHAIEQFGDDWMRPENLVSNGPFRLVEWRTNNFIHVTANTSYYEAEQVCLSDVYYYPTVDTASAERRVRTGELDANREFDATRLAFLEENNPDLVRMSPGLNVNEITLNTQAPPFDDVRVRQAMSMSIDRQFIADQVLAGADAPVWRVVPEAISGTAETVSMGFADDPMEVRRDFARGLLEAAGYGPENPLRFSLYFHRGGGWPRIVPVIQADWALIAPWVEVELLGRDTQLHYDALRAGDYQAGSGGWIPDFDDPYAYLLQWESRAADMNYTRWQSDQYDEWVDAAVNSADPAMREDLYGRAEQLVIDEAAMIPIFRINTKNLVGPRVTGWVANPVAINRSRWLCVDGGSD